MKCFLFILALLLIKNSYSQQSEPSIRDLKHGEVVSDSSYIYRLPYPKGVSHFLIQGYMSHFSHKGEYALDFKMRRGSKVCAARSGVVVAVREDSDKGGLKPAMISEGNHVIIIHPDGSEAYYWHLQKNGALVNEGDTVKEGQVIGLSGNTGYTAFPHLHFEVVVPGKGQIPTRFVTKKRVRYLRPGRWYRAL